MISRRLFVFGAAATVATASLAPPGVTVLRSHRRYVWRDISYLFASFPHGGPAEIAMITVTREHSGPLIKMGISTHGTLMWHAPPGCQLISFPSSPLSIELLCNQPFGEIQLECRDRYADGTSSFICERHTFGTNGEVLQVSTHQLYA